MTKPKIMCTDEEFIKLYETHGPTKAGKILKVATRSIHYRKQRIEATSGAQLISPRDAEIEFPHRYALTIKNGYVIVGSDFHIWPGNESVALRAFKKLCKDLKPAAVILNGDVLDFPQISRHSAIMWETQPVPVEEIEAAQDHLNDIVKSVGRAHKVWTIGNHDARFEAFISQHAHQLKGIKGSSLIDHFALWHKVWSVWINDDIVIKHRFKGGIHAPHNNTVNAGKSMFTGHLHSQKVTPFTDYNGTRYGVDTGCVADTQAKAFVNYTEDNPKNWVSGFAVLKFINGKLLYPQLVTVWDKNSVQFNGEIIRV